MENSTKPATIQVNCEKACLSQVLYESLSCRNAILDTENRALLRDKKVLVEQMSMLRVDHLTMSGELRRLWRMEYEIKKLCDMK